MDYAIETKNLTKYFGSLCAVDQINLKIKRGCCFGILGPNGAGKTSLMEMIEGISTVSKGEVFIDGMNIKQHLSEIQQKISVQLQENNYFDFTSINKLLKFFLAMYPKSEITPADLLKKVNLCEKKNVKYKDLSGGQKQRFSIAVALVNKADIYFFDEPTTGLDPQNRQFIWNIILDLLQKKKTVILTTHSMEEAEALCEELIIMDHAKIIAQGTCEELKKQISEEESITFSLKEAIPDIEVLKNKLGIKNLIKTHIKYQYNIWTSNLLSCLKNLINFSNESNNPIENMSIHRITLEDVFLKLTSRELRE